MNTEHLNEDSEINPVSNFVKKLKKEMKDENGEYKPLSLKKAFWVVGALHAVAIGGIVLFTVQSKARAAQAADDKKFLESVPEMVGVEYPEPAKVSATPIPKPIVPIVEKKEIVAPVKPKIITKTPSNPNPNYPQYTTEYVVKQGDNFTKIVKKYGLNAEKLKKLNNIKDENKLTVGQKLKFM